jgi:hypothetical protein
MDGAGVVCYLEHWRTREVLDQHLRFALFRLILEAMECSHQSPDVAFYAVTEIGGLSRQEL